jgi:hypothetical protein
MYSIKHPEVVKQIKDFPTYYISNYGNVYSVKENSLIKLKHGYKGQKLYKCVHLMKKNQPYSKYVHHLVAKAFLGFETNRQIVIDHIDENHTNNYIENLQIITQRENISKAKKLKRKLPTGVTLSHNGNKFKSYITINKQPKYLGTFNNVFQAKRAYDEALALIPHENQKYPINYLNATSIDKWNPHLDNFKQIDMFNNESVLKKAKKKFLKFLTSFTKTA